MPGRPVAILDACVLYPARLRDLLLSLAAAGIFRARWSADIHEEWTRAVLAQNKGNPNITLKKLQRTRTLMDAAVPDSLVTGYQPLIPRLSLPDPNDRHVAAAAIKCGAQTIVTFNLKHFPENSLAKFGISAQYPDNFVTRLIGLDEHAVCKAVRQHRARLLNPPFTADEYLDSLAQQRLPRTVESLRPHRHLI